MHAGAFLRYKTTVCNIWLLILLLWVHATLLLNNQTMAIYEDKILYTYVTLDLALVL